MSGVLPVADGAIATVNTALGRLVPVLIVDTSDRPDIDDTIEAHTTQPPGDVIVQWGKPTGPGADPAALIHLIIHFIRPIDSYVVIKFGREQSGLVDQIIRSQLVYLQSGHPGDRLSNTFDDKRILVEIRETGFEEIWEKMFFDSTVAELSSRGLNRKQSIRGAREAISGIRELGDIRIRLSQQFGQE